MTDTAPPTPRVIFTEGSIQLPSGYEDRSSNLLVPANTQTQANLSVARDWMKPGENLAQYVDRQMGVLRSQLASHKLLDRRPVRLGHLQALEANADTNADADTNINADTCSPAPAHSVLLGECIDATYRNGKQVIYNRQAAFEVAPSRVLIFSASKTNGFSAEFETLWANWLASYQAPPPALVAQDPPPASPPAEGA